MKVTPLIQAIWKEDDNLIRQMAKDALAINEKDSDGRTALIEAIVKQHLEYVELFIQNGADVNTIDADGWMPIHFAAQEYNPSIVKLLLSKKVLVNEKNQHGNPPLFIALNNLNRDRASTLEICHLLLEAGADPTIENNYGVSVISLYRDTIQDKEIASFLSEYIRKSG